MFSHVNCVVVTFIFFIPYHICYRAMDRLVLDYCIRSYYYLGCCFSAVMAGKKNIYWCRG